MKWAGLDELIFEGRSSRPLLVVITEGHNGPHLELRPANRLLGLDTHQKIMALQRRYADAHFAVIGPAGEHDDACYFAAVASVRQPESHDPDASLHHPRILR